MLCRLPIGRSTSGEVEKLSSSAAADASLEVDPSRSDKPGVLGLLEVSRTSDSSPYAGKDKVAVLARVCPLAPAAAAVAVGGKE